MAHSSPRRSKTVSGGHSASVEFVSNYKDSAGNFYSQENKIVDYAGSSSTPDRVFSVEGTTPPIIVCDKDTTLGCDMVSLQAESFDAATIAAFDALVTAGTIPNLSVDKTDPAKPVIKFPADNIKLTESIDGRGFCLTAGTGSDTVTVEVDAREISVKSSSGIDQKVPHPDADKTYNLALSKKLVEDCFDSTKTDRIIQTSTAGVVSAVTTINDLSPEFAVALAQTAAPAAGESHGSVRYGDLEFFIGYKIEGIGPRGGTTRKNIVLVKEPVPGTPPSTKMYLLQSGKFREVLSTTLKYGDKSRLYNGIDDLGICFKLSASKTIELPIKVPDVTDPITGLKAYDDSHTNKKFLDGIINFTHDPATIRHTGLFSPIVTGAPLRYNGISIGFDDGTAATILASSVRFSVTDISDPSATPSATPPATPSATPPATPSATPPAAAPTSAAKADSGTTNVSTTKSISGLDKIVKSFGQLGLVAGFFLFVGAVLMPALLPTAIGVLAAGAGVYLGSNLVAGNYDITLNKIIGNQTAREAKRKKEHKKFMKLDAKLKAIDQEIDDITARDNEQAQLDSLIHRLQHGGPITAAEVTEFNDLDSKRTSGVALTPAETEELALLDRMQKYGLLDPTEAATFASLEAKRTSTGLTIDEAIQYNELKRLKLAVELDPTELAEFSTLDGKRTSGVALTPAETRKLALLDRVNAGLFYVSPEEAARLATLTATESARNTRYNELVGPGGIREKLENKEYKVLANTDLKTILAIKSQVGDQAEKDEERRLKAAFAAAHAATPATEDEIKQFNQDLATQKKAARVAAEKDFIADNEYSITRNVMAHTRDKRTKAFIQKLSSDERSFITDAAADLSRESSTGIPSSHISGADIVDELNRRSMGGGFFKKLGRAIRYGARDKKAKDVAGKLYNSTAGVSYSEEWINDYIDKYENFEKALEALKAAGASDAKMKIFMDHRKVFERETDKTLDTIILESNRTSANKRSKVSAKMQAKRIKERNKAGVDPYKMDHPEELGR